MNRKEIMKNTRLILFAAALTWSAAGLAQTPAGREDAHWGRKYVGPEPQELFSAKEISLDMFASYSAPETEFSHLFQTNIRDGGTIAGGAGLNYFLTKAIGVGGEVNIPNNGGSFVDMVSASLIVRVPIEKASLAPYIFGGGGRTTDKVWEWTQHAGVGLEFRINRETGIFVDGRYVWADESSDSLLLRAGLRLVF
jgi:hypothetical protein